MSMSWLCKIHSFCTSRYIFLVRIKSISHLNKFSSSTAYYLNSEFSMLIIIIYIATRSISHERGEKCFNRWRTKTLLWSNICVYCCFAVLPCPVLFNNSTIPNTHTTPSPYSLSHSCFSCYAYEIIFVRDVDMQKRKFHK